MAAPFLALTVAALVLTVSSPARAQLFEQIGVRAQGMAGAFVAVADDASATWWNPAGRATGAYFNGIVEHGRIEGDGAFGVSVAYPALGLGYYRVRLRSLVVNQFGATVGHSLGEHLVVGSNVKIVRGEQTRGDLDLGAAATFKSARVAIAVRHIGAPDVGTDRNPIELERQVRVGVTHTSTLSSGAMVTSALDADLTKTTTPDGDARHVAAGVEVWPKPRLGVRGGVSANTVGDVRGAASVGASVGVRSGLFLDGFVTRGDDEAKKGWGLALRASF